MEFSKIKEVCKKELENLSTTPASTNPKSINSNNGRWTKEEHNMFIRALELYGKNWKKVEEHIGTRTGAQIRSHAQKFFIKLDKEQTKKKDKDKTGGETGSQSNHKSKQSENRKADISSDSDMDDDSKGPTLVLPSQQREIKSVVNSQINTLSYPTAVLPHHNEKKLVEKKQPQIYTSSCSYPFFGQKIEAETTIPDNFDTKTHEPTKSENTCYNKPEEITTKLLDGENFGMDFILDSFLLQQQKININPQQRNQVYNLSKKEEEPDVDYSKIMNLYGQNKLFQDVDMSELLDQTDRENDDNFVYQQPHKRIRKQSQSIQYFDDLNNYCLDQHKKKIKQNAEPIETIFRQGIAVRKGTL